MVTANKKGKGIAPGSKRKVEELTPEEQEKRLKMIQQVLYEKFHKERKRYLNEKPHLFADSLKSLRKEKGDDIKKFVQFLMENYEKEMHKQQHSIDVYFEDFQKCRNQFGRLRGSHAEFVGELIRLFHTSVENIENQFHHFFTMLEKDFTESVKSIKDFSRKKEEEISKISKDFEERDSRERKVMEVNFMSDSEVLVKRYSKFFEVMKIEMGKVVKATSESYDDLMKTEIRKVGNLFSQYRVIKKEDFITKTKINELVKSLKYTREKNNEWKAKHLNNLKNFQKRNNLLKTEITVVKDQYRILKRRMSKFQNGEKKRLLRLVKMTNSAKECLERRGELSCRLLQRKRMVDPLETEKERSSFLKYCYKYEKDEDDEDEVGNEEGLPPLAYSKNNNKKKKEEEGKEKKKHWNVMKRYYKKVNGVTLSTNALERERAILVKKNKELRKKLRVFISGISVNPQIMSEKNSLLIQKKINLTHKRLPAIKNIML